MPMSNNLAVRRFIGLPNYLLKLVEGFAVIVLLLTDLLYKIYKNMQFECTKRKMKRLDD